MSDPHGKSANDRRAFKAKTRGNKQHTVKPLEKNDQGGSKRLNCADNKLGSRKGDVAKRRKENRKMPLARTTISCQIL